MSKTAVPRYLTTEQLGEAAIATIKQMSPEEKRVLRDKITLDLFWNKAARKEFQKMKAAEFPN